jgi:dTDP-4-dehydrorhamnose reductase
LSAPERPRVLVLGATGMLGSMAARVLGANPAIEVARTAREGGAGMLPFDAEREDLAALLDETRCEWVLNAIGLLAARIDESDPASVARAEAVNGEFPHRLAAALGPERRAIAVGTDAVFSGTGPHDESAPHEPDGAYARSKDRGEVEAEGVLQLRCSIVGPELGPPRSLLGWILSQPPGARVEGWSDQRWNGVTTLAFARIVEAIVTGAAPAPPSPLHVVPADALTKAELLEAILAAFGREDVEVAPRPSGRPADRTLATRHPEESRALWAAAGYAEPPSIAALLAELAAYVR